MAKENLSLMAFDFFCGAGGLSRGLHHAGIKVLAGFDHDGNCQESYEYNNPNVRFIEKDIRKITLDDLKQHAKGINFDEMLFAGCAPCQPFTQQIKNGEGKQKDATLLGEFGRLVEAALPGRILIENVPGIVKVKGNSTFKKFLRLLDRYKYHYVFEVLNAKQFGVPQSRRRLILIASRHLQPTIPLPTHGSGLLPYSTVRQAISCFPAVAAGETHKGVPNHTTASIMPVNIERLRHTPPDGGGRLSWPRRLYLKCHKGTYKGHTDVYGRMYWDRPAPALTGRCYSISNGRYGHPVQNRAMSLREAAALQSFPDDYIFFGSNKHVALQIGNAVPVKLAEALGRHIIQMKNEI